MATNVEANQPESIMDSSSIDASPYSDVYHTIEAGHAIFNSKGELVESDGHLHDNTNLTAPLIEIIKTLRLHSLMKLTKDSFKGITLQFTDHYYKIDLSTENAVVYKYLLKVSDQHIV